MQKLINWKNWQNITKLGKRLVKHQASYSLVLFDVGKVAQIYYDIDLKGVQI